MYWNREAIRCLEQIRARDRTKHGNDAKGSNIEKKKFCCVFTERSRHCSKQFHGETKAFISEMYSYAKRTNKRPDNWSFVRQFVEGKWQTHRKNRIFTLVYFQYKLIISQCKLNINAMFVETARQERWKCGIELSKEKHTVHCPWRLASQEPLKA